MTKAEDIFDKSLTSAKHVLYTTVTTILGSTLWALAFSRVCFLTGHHISLQTHVHEILCFVNRIQYHYEYATVKQALKKVHDPTTSGV